MVPVTTATPSIALMLLQPETPRITANALHFTIVVGLFLLVVVVVMVYVLRKLRPRIDDSSTSALREEFEKGKDTLLMAAQAKKAAREADEGADRQREAEERERELLKQNVTPQRVIGETCPLSGLQMMNDQELVIDPYTGQGYHFSAFLNDWPEEHERPKYVYRYPQGVIIKSKDLVRRF